jgi:D-threo-aldose 1-dehydrogenase
MARDWMRRLPNGKPISALGFGCSSLWAKPGFGEERAQDVLEAARDGGINHFDTAPSYGAGHGERRLGAFLARHGAEDFVVSTKIGGNLIDGQVVRSFDLATVRKSFEGSLQRLGVERVDMLYLHGPQEAELTDELLRFLEDEKARGRIGYSGMESGNLALFRRMPGTPLDVAMLHYNAVDQSAEPLIQALVAAGKTIVSGTSLAQAKFAFGTFVPRGRNSLWYALRMAKNDPFFWLRGPGAARRLKQLRPSAAAAAIGFVTAHPLITSGLFGSSSPDHVAANAEAGHHPLTPAERQTLLTAASARLASGLFGRERPAEAL